MKSRNRFFVALFFGLTVASTVQAIDGNAMKPPMGWNSYDGIGSGYTDTDIKKAADNMAAQLKKCGYEYIVVDAGWYGSGPAMDAYGRLIPYGNGMDSDGAGGKGSFKAIADYCHNLGLKFGVWNIRGIPRVAYDRSLPVKGTTYTARDITDISSVCPWMKLNYGLKWSHSGAQAYITSLVETYVTWGLDFIKIDDVVGYPGSLPEVYHKNDIEGYRKALRSFTRPMIFSISPGNHMAIADAPHAVQYTDMFRVTGDLWDSWSSILKEFKMTTDYNQYNGPGHWVDLDMLPLGKLRTGPCRLTVTEQKTVMSLWCIFRAPLILGTDIRTLDAQILSIIANEEIIGVDQNSTNSRKIFDKDSLIIWTSDVPGSGTPITKNVAFFNLRGSAATMNVTLADLGYTGQCRVRDLWAKAPLPDAATTFSASVPSHGSGMYRITPLNVSTAEHGKSPVRTCAAIKVYVDGTQLAMDYSVPSPAPVSINLYSLKGALVRTLVNEYKDGGDYRTVLHFDGEQSNASLRYLLVAKIGHRTLSKKVIIIK